VVGTEGLLERVGDNACSDPVRDFAPECTAWAAVCFCWNQVSSDTA